MFASKADADVAAGAHPLPFCKPVSSREEGEAVVAVLADAAAVVYTDGGCTRNGRAGATATVGVFWGTHSDPRNVSRRARGAQTNNVAELEGIEAALDGVLGDAALLAAPVVVISDSSYSINCLTKWYAGFVARGWKVTGARDDVKNRDLLERVHAKLKAAPLVRLLHCRGHQGIPGNEAADALASAAFTVAAAAP